MLLSVEAFRREAAAVDKGETSSPDQFPHCVGNQDLSACRLLGYSRRQDHAGAEQVAVFVDGSPAFKPIRTESGGDSVERPVELCASTLIWSEIAHSTALETLSKEAMNPSPRVLTSVPPCFLRAARVICSCSRSTSRPLSSPSVDIITVWSTRSVKSTAVNDRSGCASSFGGRGLLRSGS